jgi:hypothetical protein
MRSPKYLADYVHLTCDSMTRTEHGVALDLHGESQCPLAVGGEHRC